MYCKSCFRRITSTSKYCRYCGAAVEDYELNKLSGETKTEAVISKDGHPMRSDKTPKNSMHKLIIALVAALLIFSAVLILVTSSSVFQKTESISYKDYIGVWEERGGKNIENDGGVRLEIHGRTADTLIISMEFYGVSEENISINELGAVIKDGKAYYSFTNDGYGNSGNGVLIFKGRDIEWKSTVNKNDRVQYTVSKVVSSDVPEDTPEDQENITETEDTESQEDTSSDYILPNSDKAYVTEDELKVLTQEELRIARNEIMARHGRMFRDPTLDAYFRSKDWYEPTLEPDEFDKKSGKLLNKFEMKNIALIKQMEE